jgi:cytochrome c-type protein NapC
MLGALMPAFFRTMSAALLLPSPESLLYALLAVCAVLIVAIAFRPALTASREGKIFAFVAFCIMPVVCTSWAASTHIERSKQATFCLSCHIMEPYGKSLYVDDPSYVAAAHFQNHRVPADEACYTCHTDYVFYGGLRAKVRGLRHIYVQYLGTPPRPEKIKLYTPYNNRECLHCHLGARSFENNPIHMAALDSLKSNQVSCISSGCHDTVHGIGSLSHAKFWRPSS